MLSNIIEKSSKKFELSPSEVTKVNANLLFFNRLAFLFPEIFHSLWWSIVTLTTVGYGDIVPITIGGKIFTFFVLIIGIGIVTVPTGLVATALTKARQIEEDELENKQT